MSLPEFKSGMKLGDLSADSLNELTRAARLLLGLNVRTDSGLEINRAHQGMSIGTTRRFQDQNHRALTKPVVIRKEPGETDKVLHVQEVVFKAHNPVRSTEIDWSPDIEFEAHPYWNLTPADYSDFVFTESTLDDTAHVLDARWVEGIEWVLDRPASAVGIKLAEVKTASSGSVLMVQPIKQDFSEAGAGAIVADGPIISAFIWPRTNGAAYQHHIVPKAIVGLFKVNGHWYVDQTIRYYTRANTAVQLADCSIG